MMSLTIGFFAIFAIVHSVSTTDPFVTINKFGKIRGTYMQGYQGAKFEAFLGIPFAKPPVGNLRYANPVPYGRIIGTWNATFARPECLQKNYLLPTPIVSGEEDCLYLNVYRPVGVSQNKSVPVMVYIHGGGFFTGTANPDVTGPEYFMDTQKVIIVTIAYRLGTFGFLSTGDDSCPGNFALKDQYTALEWVHKNIRKFGGRPNSVTIFGQSAGAVSAHLHMLSPLSRKNLFQRVIAISGNANAPWIVMENPLEQALEQAKHVGIAHPEQMTTKNLIEALRDISASDLIQSGDKFKYWNVDPLTEFRPVIERKRSAGAFMTEDPREIIRKGNFRHLPWMTTFVPYEGAVRALAIVSNDTLTEQFNVNFDDLLIKLMEMPYETEEERSHMVDQLVQYYMNGSHILTKENDQGLGNMISGRGFLQPLYNSLRDYVQYANIQKNPVYVSKFAYRGLFSYSAVFSGNNNNYGVVHCDDLIYLFRSPALFPDFAKNSTDAKVSAAIIENLVTFAIEGRPMESKPIESCSIESFLNRKVQQFCDIQEFENTHGSYQISITNEFDVNEVEFWNDILS